MATARELRHFGLILAAFVALLFGALLPWLGVLAPRSWVWVLAAGLAAVALGLPRALAPLHRAWSALGHALGWLNTRVLLGVVFLGVIWPTGALRRLLRRPMMPKGPDPSQPSYRVARPVSPPSDHYDRPY